MKSLRCMAELHRRPARNHPSVKRLSIPVGDHWEYVEFKYDCADCGAYCFSGDIDDRKTNLYFLLTTLVIVIIGATPTFM